MGTAGEANGLGLIPVFLDLKAPVKMQMVFPIVVHELADSFIMATEEHSRRSLLFRDCGTLASPFAYEGAPGLVPKW